MNWNISEGAFEKNTLLSDSIEDKLSKYASSLVEQNVVVFSYLLAYSFFAIDDYDRSLDWTNRILNTTEPTTLSSLQISARILHLLSHYASGNTEVVLYLIDQVRRMMRKNAKAYVVESDFVKGISDLIKKSPDKRKGILMRMKSSLKENPGNGNFDYLSWEESALRGIPFREVFQEKVDPTH